MTPDVASARPDVLYVLVRGADPEIYGGERSTLVTAAGVAAQGYLPRFLVTADDQMARAVEGAGFECDVVPVGDPFRGLRGAAWRGKLSRARDILQTNRGVARHRPQIVHAAMVTGFFCSWMGARMCGAKSIYHVRTASRGLRTKWTEQLAILLADEAIAVSPSLRRQLIDTAHPWLRRRLEQNLRVITNGFDFTSYDAMIRERSRQDSRRRTGPAEDRVSLIFVAGIRPDKGQLRFVEEVLPALVTRRPNVSVAFIGGVQDEAYAQQCREAIARHRLEQHVTFAGYLPPEGVCDWYLGADIAVLPSEREGLPRAGVEAAAFGLPIVATAVVGNVDVVVEGKTGHLVPRDHIRQMVEPLDRLAGDPGLRRRLGTAGAEHVRANYSVARNVDGVVELYRELARFTPPGNGRQRRQTEES